jgi:hypothetical protein
LILERAGHVVVPILDEDAIPTACKQNKFEVAVVGQAMSAKNKRRIAHFIRESCPGTKVLELYSISSGKVIEDADSWLEVLTDLPQDLATRVTELASHPPK